VFNSLVVLDQHVAQNSLASIVSDLASDWSWDEVGTALTFRLRQGCQLARRQAVHQRQAASWRGLDRTERRKTRLNRGLTAA
jgi:hypothetical protein